MWEDTCNTFADASSNTFSIDEEFIQLPPQASPSSSFEIETEITHSPFTSLSDNSAIDSSVAEGTLNPTAYINAVIPDEASLENIDMLIAKARMKADLLEEQMIRDVRAHRVTWDARKHDLTKAQSIVKVRHTSTKAFIHYFCRICTTNLV